MRKNISFGLWLAAVLIGSGTAGFAIEAKLTIENPETFGRTREPLSAGIPFARGAVADVGRLAAYHDGRPFPAQFTLLSPWEDGSVRWALLDMQGNFKPGSKTEIAVRASGANPAAPVRVAVTQNDAEILVSTGPMAFTIGRDPFTLFRSLKVDGQERLTGAGRGLVLTASDGKTYPAGPPTEVALEHEGPVKTVVRLRGTIPGVHNNLLRYTARIAAYAGQKRLKMHVWLENEGDYGYGRRVEWFNFKGFHLDMGLDLGGPIAASCEGVSAQNAFRVEQRCDGHKYADFKYTVTDGKQELKSGARTDGVVSLRGPRATLTAAIRHFWQNYEKAIELDGNTLRLWLWPVGGEWPRQNVKRGRSRNEFGQYRKAGEYALPGGVHKGHEILLDFSGAEPEEAAAFLNRPLLAQATPAYMASTLAAPGWFAPMDFRTGIADHDARLAAWNRMALNAVDPAGNGSLIRARNGAGEQMGFWYGWMDFGDLCWASGACSLHYDWTWIMLLNYLRSGDSRFMDMGLEMARHRMDVDQIWSDRVEWHFRGLTRFERASADTHGEVDGGRGKPITSHHWSSGLALHYVLTGDEKAKEAALRSADGVVLRQVNRFRDKPNAGDQSRSSGWAILVLCSAYDITGDRKWLDEALILWNNNLKVKWKEKNDATFGDGAGGLQYFYCLYPLIQLHDRTDDPDLLAFLKEGAAAGNWSDRPVEVNHYTDFYAYLGWKTDNPAYLAKAREALALAMGTQSNPAVYTGSGAWTKESAKRLRYAHVLNYVEWLQANP